MSRRTLAGSSAVVESEQDASLAATQTCLTSGEQLDDGTPTEATEATNAQVPNSPVDRSSHNLAGGTPTEPNVTPAEQTPSPSGTAAALIMVPLCLSVTMAALDLTIVTPAIPAMVSDFNSESGYVWIGSAFILASTASTPVWGSVADIWGRKPIILISVAIFLVGSLLCALSTNIDTLVAGRTVQGLGASGMGTMVNVIICDTFSLRDRGLYLAITSIVWAVASAVGPVIGGIFTTMLRSVGLIPIHPCQFR